MTHVRTLTAGLIVTLVTAAMSTNVAAQTTAPGAYYAPPAWSQTLAASTRFIVLSNFNNDAVLDRETGLMWQRAANSTIGADWFSASHLCLNLIIASRKGWRLPTAAEFSSLVDAGQQDPALPANHPFTNVGMRGPNDVFGPFYWTSTEAAGYPADARVVDIGTGYVAEADKRAKSEGLRTWCVRGQSDR